jgi:ParB-like chromosome segregation protein Spo0J
MTISIVETKPFAVSELLEYPGNARRGNVDEIAASLAAHGQYRALVVGLRTRHVLAGNHTLQGMRRLGWTEALCSFVDADPDEERRIVLVDNRTQDLANYDHTALAELLREAKEAPGGLEGTGYTEATLEGLLREIEEASKRSEDDGEGEKAGDGPTLTERFGVPPFSVLDARQGYWQERKKAWIALGIRSELGRGEGVRYSEQAERKLRSGRYEQALTWGISPRGEATRAKPTTFASHAVKQIDHYKRERAGLPDRPEDGAYSGTSVFDPVLCELAYRWFSPKGGLVLDPFAGGSVRGIVAAKMGRRYIGVELRPEQVAANREQQAELLAVTEDLEWFEGDSRDVLAQLSIGDERLGPGADLVFSCPPYADLEVYSDDPRDLSKMTPEDFRAAYGQIIAASVRLLREDRFAVWVVGEVRGPDGFYRGLIRDTIAAFEAAGARLYNEAILVTMIASLSIRAGRSFEAARKLGKGHQQFLVFVKGDPKKATAALGPVEGGVYLGEQEPAPLPMGDGEGVELAENGETNHAAGHV